MDLLLHQNKPLYIEVGPCISYSYCETLHDSPSPCGRPFIRNHMLYHDAYIPLVTNHHHFKTTFGCISDREDGWLDGWMDGGMES